MKRLALAGVLGLLSLPASAPAPAHAAEAKAAPTAPTMSAADLRNGMRKLWSEHTIYTHSYIVSALAGLPDLPTVTQRLLRNQDDIGNAIRPYYGDAAGDRLTSLLREHILVAADVVGETKAGNSSAAQAAERKWRANAEEIATFLSGANPDSWPLDTMRREMNMHLDLTLQEASARLHGRWAADVAAYDAVHDHVLHFADMLSDGLVGRVPVARIADAPVYVPPGYHAVELVGPPRGP